MSFADSDYWDVQITYAALDAACLLTLLDRLIELCPLEPAATCPEQESVASAAAGSIDVHTAEQQSTPNGALIAAALLMLFHIHKHS